MEDLAHSLRERWERLSRDCPGRAGNRPDFWRIWPSSLGKGLRSLLAPLRWRLSRHVAVSIFLSIVAIEIIILVPSCRSYRKNLLLGLEEVAWARVSLLAQIASQPGPRTRLLSLFDQVVRTAPLVGGTVYREGRRVATFGEAPRLSPGRLERSGTARKLEEGARRYHLGWSSPRLKAPWSFIIRLDTSSVTRQA